MGPIGPSGIFARIHKGMRIEVERVDPGTPAEGKFKKGDILLGINGVLHKGRNPLVVFGTAITDAEATDGVLTFDVQQAGSIETNQITIKIPVLGPYSETYPLECQKSKAIVKKAAKYYADEQRLKKHDLWNALACLFLLSTGDDAYVPRVKAYFSQFLNKDGTTTGLSEHSWPNGYNGIAVAEYFLRTGDKSVLPILQYYCDDARRRQKYGLGWGHGGYSVFPSYESGGGVMHSAGNQILATLMLGKLCGVQVDDKTLLGALRHWYRFAGHGAIPASDKRTYRLFRSAGRDGATAAIMHIADMADGDTSAYKKAKEYLALSALTSWPARTWDWEVYWHNIGGQFARDTRPDLYRQTMDRFRWRYDLGRSASGAFHWSERVKVDDHTKAGICLALAYTAPMRTLQITGAPRSKYATKFSLPEQLWGNDADRAFLSTQHHPDYYLYGEEEEIHIPYWQLKTTKLSYSPSDVKNLPLEMLQKNVRHWRYAMREASAKALCFNGYYDEIERLLIDDDPRLRRAALDGINECSHWFTGHIVGKNALKPENYTPGMVLAIEAMLTNPDEASYVVDGALNALNHAPVEVIEKNLPKITPWLESEEWWLRHSAFNALMGLKEDERLFVAHLPSMIEAMIKEYRWNPRHQMVRDLKDAMVQYGEDSPVGEMIIAGLTRAALESEIRPDIGKYRRSREGLANVIETALISLDTVPDPATVITISRFLADHADALSPGDLVKLVHAPIPLHLSPPSGGHGHQPGEIIGLYDYLKKLPPEQSKTLERLLFTQFRAALVRRLVEAKQGDHFLIEPLSDSIVELTKLAKSAATDVDTGALKPNPATFAKHPATLGIPEIVMTATKPNDRSGPVEYFFDETSGNPGGTDSVWTTNPVYRDTGLEPRTRYTYTVKTRDVLLQTSAGSAPVSVVTPAVDCKTVVVPNGGFETIYKPGQTTITATLSGWTHGVGPACPISGGYNFSDHTSGASADIPGWAGYDTEGWLKYGGTDARDKSNGNLQGLVQRGGRGGGNSYNANGGAWRNRAGGLIVSAAPLGKIQKGATYVLVAHARGIATPFVLNLLADGEVVMPTRSVTPASDKSWQKFSRTYLARDLARYVGKRITIVCGLGRDAKGQQIAIDDVSLRYYTP